MSTNIKLDPRDRSTIEWVCRESDGPRDRSLVRGLHISALRDLFARRHGKQLPDTKAARNHLLALLRNMATIPRIRTATLTKEVDRWAAWISRRERSDLVHTAQMTPCVHRSVTLGRIVGLVDAERRIGGYRSIWPIDLSLAESKLRKKERDRARQTENRRAAGARPQSQSLSKTKPWLAAGFKCRRTWERHLKKASNETVATSSRILKNNNLYIGDEIATRPVSRPIELDSIDFRQFGIIAVTISSGNRVIRQWQASP